MAQVNNHIMQSQSDVLSISNTQPEHEYRGVAPVVVDNLDDTISVQAKPIEIHYPLSGNLSDEKFELGLTYPFTFSTDEYSNTMLFDKNVLSSSGSYSAEYGYNGATLNYGSLEGQYGPYSINLVNNNDATQYLKMKSNAPLIEMRNGAVSASLNTTELYNLKNNMVDARLYDETVSPATYEKANSIRFVKSSNGQIYCAMIGDTQTYGGFFQTIGAMYSDNVKTFDNYSGTSDVDTFDTIFTVEPNKMLEGTFTVDGLYFDNTATTCIGNMQLFVGNSKITEKIIKYEWLGGNQDVSLDLPFMYYNSTNSAVPLKIILNHTGRVAQQHTVFIRLNGRYW